MLGLLCQLFSCCSLQQPETKVPTTSSTSEGQSGTGGPPHSYFTYPECRPQPGGRLPPISRLHSQRSKPRRRGVRPRPRFPSRPLSPILEHPPLPPPRDNQGLRRRNRGPRPKPYRMAGNNNNTFPSLDTSFNNRSPSPGVGSQVNGANGMNNGANYLQPLPVGHQQDLNYLYAQIQELSNVLANNREKVNEITHNAEEVARRANQSNGVSHEADDHESDRSRLRELEHEVVKANKIIDLYKHEQRENTLLIAQYEDALGTATEQIRNYCNDIETRFLSQRRHYNNLLQAEKDEHFQSRLDRDRWQAETLRVSEMIRTANQLRTEEWGDEYRVVRGLQEEVRCLRNCLGMEPEKPEEETGWPYLREDLSQRAQPQNAVPQQMQG